MPVSFQMMLAELALQQQLLKIQFLNIVSVHICMHVSILERRGYRLSSAREEFSWFNLEAGDKLRGLKSLSWMYIWSEWHLQALHMYIGTKGFKKIWKQRIILQGLIPPIKEDQKTAASLFTLAVYGQKHMHND